MSARSDRWLAAVAARVVADRPDLADEAVALLGVDPTDDDPLAGATIGRIGAAYEAMLAAGDPASRKAAGQYFTPDDAAAFMASHAHDMPGGVWLDPCCGVGNLSWHLAATRPDPATFLAEDLVLMDRDPVALITAVVLLAARFGDADSLSGLARRAVCRDATSPEPWPDHDLVIANPPYGRSDRPGHLVTGPTGELYAHFLERIAAADGFVAVTPSSWLSAARLAPVRQVMAPLGGRVYAFDNMPDTFFRGPKYGSTNTNKVNSVRAAVTVHTPGDTDWRITPALCWAAASRERMFAGAADLLADRRVGPGGRWVRVHPDLAGAWDELAATDRTLADLLVTGPTPHRLTVATTPRYYVSAAVRDLDRSSREVLYFATTADRDVALLVLNSSAPLLWWRGLDGGLGLSRALLTSVPVPEVDPDTDLVDRLIDGEDDHLVTKVNAGRVSENVKRPASLVSELDALVFSGDHDFSVLSASDLFPLAAS